MRSILLLSVASLYACADKPAVDDTSAPDDTGTPSACVEENGACVLTGTYTEDLTLTADKPWLLRSLVTIGDDSGDVTLTIEPGTTIYGESASNGLLVVTRGAKIHAEGTAAAPIVFTSDQPEGSRARGDWGGVVLNGRGKLNVCADGADPCEATGEGGTGTYGGSDNADSSGVLKYVVIQFGGTEVSADNEVNGLGLQGVGSGTVIDYVQIHKNLDDGIEFFGGAVDVKHLVVSGTGDDLVDWDLGWQGRIQHVVGVQSTDAGNNGIEADNNEDNHAASPMSGPTISNLTLVGAEGIAEDNFGILLRRGTAAKLHNVAITGFSSACLALRDQQTYDNFGGGASSLDHAVLACATAFETDPEESETGTEDDVFAGGQGNSIVDDLLLADAFNATAPDFRPTASSPLATGGQAPSDGFFDAATHIGAFDANTDWTEGWAQFPAN